MTWITKEIEAKARLVLERRYGRKLSSSELEMAINNLTEFMEAVCRSTADLESDRRN